MVSEAPKSVNGMQKDIVYSGRSFYDRLPIDSDEKTGLATFVAKELIENEDTLFFATGTTCYQTASQAMQMYGGLRIVTNSVHIAHLYSELHKDGRLGLNNVLRVPAGAVRVETGIIEHRRLNDMKGAKLFVSPHGIDEKGVSGDRDVPTIKNAITSCGNVFFLATSRKFGKRGTHVVRSIGKISEATRKKAKSFTLVTTEGARACRTNGDIITSWAAADVDMEVAIPDSD